MSFRAHCQFINHHKPKCLSQSVEVLLGLQTPHPFPTPGHTNVKNLQVVRVQEHAQSQPIECELPPPPGVPVNHENDASS